MLVDVPAVSSQCSATPTAAPSILCWTGSVQETAKCILTNVAKRLTTGGW